MQAPLLEQSIAKGVTVQKILEARGASEVDELLAFVGTVNDWEERTGLPGTRRRNFGVTMDPADNYRPRTTSPLPPVLEALGARCAAETPTRRAAPRWVGHACAWDARIEKTPKHRATTTSVGHACERCAPAPSATMDCGASVNHDGLRNFWSQNWASELRTELGLRTDI